MLLTGQDHASWISTFSTSTLPCRTPNCRPEYPEARRQHHYTAYITPLCLSHLNNLLKAAGKRSPFHDCNITVNTLREWDVKCILPSGLWAQQHWSANAPRDCFGVCELLNSKHIPYPDTAANRAAYGPWKERRNLILFNPFSLTYSCFIWTKKVISKTPLTWFTRRESLCTPWKIPGCTSLDQWLALLHSLLWKS